MIESAPVIEKPMPTISMTDEGRPTLKSRRPVDYENKLQFEQSFEVPSRQEQQDDDKGIVDFFQGKYLESQEVESVNYQRSDLNESMQQRPHDASVTNELLDQSLVQKREFIEGEFDRMGV